jgi:hypothetical protein
MKPNCLLGLRALTAVLVISPASAGETKLAPLPREKR